MPPPKKSLRREIVRVLEAEIGDGSELIAQLKKIALGQPIEVAVPEIPGVVKVLTPTISEMHAACMDLLAYRHGKPRQSVEIEHTVDRPRYRPELLTVPELMELERITRKAQIPDSIDGDFQLLPEGKPE